MPAKHKGLTTTYKKMPSCENNRDELYECECGMVYKHRQSLNKHQKNAENAKKCRKTRNIYMKFVGHSSHL